MLRAATLLLMVVFVIAAQPRQKPLWLDAVPKPALKQWNRPGAAVPKTEKILHKDDDELFLKMCQAQIRKPETPEEREVAGKGWMVFASWRDGRGTTVVGAMANLDGMCRPDLYQDFVFANGVYAGTLSPKLMGSRSDGSSVTVAFPAAGKVYAEFVRYTEKDPLCCASRISEATYEIQDTGGKPVVVLSNVRTRLAN
jgi:hypothetical protein